MSVDETFLAQNNDFSKLKVISSTQISNRVTAVTSKLNVSSTDGKPTIVALTAKAKDANKLISIIEIAKRELAAAGTEVFQYNALGSEMVEIPRVKTSKGKFPIAGKEVDEGDESDDAFEAMGAADGGGMKRRLLPTMTTYLSTTSSKELRTAYGYVSHSCCGSPSLTWMVESRDDQI
jgi:hypothetical protein